MGAPNWLFSSIVCLCASGLWAAELTSVDPRLVSTAGGTVITLHGSGFQAGDAVRLLSQSSTDVRTLQGVQVLDATRIRGTLPGLTQGVHDVQVVRGNLVVIVAAELDGAIEAANPPSLRSLTPAELCAEGGTPVTVSGASFRPETVVRIGSHELVKPAVSRDGSEITGFAPPLKSSETAGPTIVTASDSRGMDVLRSGVTYTARCASARLPGPDEIETSLAEGTARFAWHNPMAYSEIRVFDAAGKLVRTLPGDATSLELPAGSATRIDLTLRGTVEEEPSEPAEATATTHQCDRPPPLIWGGQPGNLNLTVYGNHFEESVARCQAPIGGGGGAAEGESSHAHSGSGGFAGPGGIGTTIPNIDLGVAGFLGGNALITGFKLPQDADKLEIACYYEKLAADFGLELRAHLVHVFPNDGFEDELSFPDIAIQQGKQLTSMTYYRADKDIGHPGNPDDPDPAKQPPEACGMTIPAGEYRLELYAVGGEGKLPYFVFADDPHDNEILIQGVPCPPYPLVKVTDVTGFRTLPDIADISAVVLLNGGLVQHPACEPGELRVRFTAQGTWLDEQNAPHAVPAVDPADANPHFEYKWIVHDRKTPTARITGAEPRLEYCIKDWGCYKVELEILDKQCGFTKKRTFEVPIVPNPDDLTCAGDLTFLFPTPDPSGVYSLVGLNEPNEPAGPGNFKGKRPVEFRVLVVPQCFCVDDDPSDCPAADIDTLEFRLAVPTPFGPNPLEGVDMEITDLCPSTTAGAKYFLVTIDDLGAIAPQEDWDAMKFYNVYFQGRRRPGSSDPNAGWRYVNEQKKKKPLKLGNRPHSLDQSFWNGHFDERDQTYHFVTKSSEKTEETLPIGPSNAIDLGLPGVDVGIPSFPNDLASGFTSRFRMHNGIWSPDEGSGTASGQVLGNKMDGAPVQVTPTVSYGGGGGSPAGGGGLIDFPAPTYEWCDHKEIFSQTFSQTLFESILYSGTIGPIPVTIWASIGLGLDILVESYTTVFVSPFGPLEGGSFAETHFYLLSTVGLSIPCEIRADVVGGLINIAVRLIPSAEFNLDTHIWSDDVSPHVELHKKAELDLTMEVEGCIELLITEACVEAEIPILENVPLIDETGDDPRDDLVTCGAGGGASIESATTPEGGGAGINHAFEYQSISAPIVTHSPDGNSSLECRFNQDGISSIEIDGGPVAGPVGGLEQGDLMNPAAAFVSNTAALIAWTDAECEASGLGDLCHPDSVDPPPPPPTLAQKNLMLAQQEIVLSSLVFVVPPAPGDPHWELAGKFSIADPSAAPNDRRADGMAAIAPDLSAMSDDPAAGQALVAWVRYDGDYLVLDGKKTIYRRFPNGPQVCVGPTPGETKMCKFFTEQVDNIRPQMEIASIYVRRVGLNGLIPGEDKVKLSPAGPGINVEPTVALSPSGEVGYCVWVHDSSIDPATGQPRKDLVTTNKGRELLYSVYQKSSDTWSAPISVLANASQYDTLYPGVLEPYMALSGDGANGLGNGLLAFTAIDKDAPDSDSGLAGNRYVFACRLEDGVFGEPFLVHGKCLRRIYGWTPVLHHDVPVAIDPQDKLNIPLPEWVMTFQGTGPIGSPEGAGNVVVATLGQGMSQWAPPVSLTNDGHIHSNVAASLRNGVLKTIHLNGGLAKVGSGVGGGAGLAAMRSFESIETRLEPDLAIAGCRLSDPFSAPGSRVTATVALENLGLAGSPHDDRGTSAVGIQALFVAEDGKTRVVATRTVPVLQPGETTELQLSLEMPHDPVKVRVELFPNPIDRNRTNDTRECFFGAPSPRGLRCRPITINDEDLTPAVELSWANQAVYDEVLVYRDGSMFASLPGGATRFVDLTPPTEQTTYWVRGRMGASKSQKTVCRLDEPPPEPGFRRGDADGDGEINITDAIFTLGFLFAGTREPGCHKAADADDSGQLDITDPILTLGFLFLGGRAPPAPGHLSCGSDPTPDALPCTAQPDCP